MFCYFSIFYFDNSFHFFSLIMILKMMVSQEVNFCHFEEQSDEKSLNYSGDFSLRSK
jgi:hypothetical protein